MCVISADDSLEEHRQWSDHPVHASWAVLQDLGAGGFADVYLARHRATGELAALKVVHLTGPAVDAAHLAVAQREPEFLRRLAGHPGVVQLRGVLPGDRHAVLVLEWLRGGPLLDALGAAVGPRYSEQAAADVFAQLVDAVAAMHAAGLIHRDIKPENVLFVDPPAERKAGGAAGAAANGGAALEGRSAAELQAAGWAGLAAAAAAARAAAAPRVKVIDLGMALDYVSSADAGPLGSAGFVAPEVALGAPHAPCMDVFSLGVLLFVMLVGRKPFSIEDSETLRYARRRLADAPGLADPRWAALSPDAKDLVTRMMAFNPAHRPTLAQVAGHEWVASRGGALVRPLSGAVLAGAATVGSMRRLRLLTGGVGGRAEVRPAGVGAATAARDPDASVRAWRAALRAAQRRERSARGGARGAVAGVARALAARSVAGIHDGGGALAPGDDPSVHFSRRGSGQSSLNPSVRGGLPRVGTSVLLSELARTESLEPSAHGGGAGMRRSASGQALSSMGLLTAAAKLFAQSQQQQGGLARRRASSRGGTPHGSSQDLAAAAAAAAAGPRPPAGGSPPRPLPPGVSVASDASGSGRIRTVRRSADNPLGAPGALRSPLTGLTVKQASLLGGRADGGGRRSHESREGSSGGGRRVVRVPPVQDGKPAEEGRAPAPAAAGARPEA